MSQAAQANYGAAVARNNQIIQMQNAQYATRAGQARAYDVALKERDDAAKIRTGIAANNIEVNSGSARDVQVGQAEKGQLSVERTVQEPRLRPMDTALPRAVSLPRRTAEGRRGTDGCDGRISQGWRKSIERSEQYRLQVRGRRCGPRR